MDPTGIEMLKSVTEIFDLVGFEMKDITAELEKLDENNFIDAVQNGKKCPVIHASRYDLKPGKKIGKKRLKSDEPLSHHVLVVTGIEPKMSKTGSVEYNVVQCKNSYRDQSDHKGNELMFTYSVLTKLHFLHRINY